MSAEWPPGWCVRRHDILASTQDEAIAAAQQNVPGRLAVLAARQTAGRGREGRSWASLPGNLSVSLMLRAPGAPVGACWAELAGLALFDSIAATGADGLTLKHPNDVMRGGAKLAGVLVDSALAADGTLDWVVIGAGVNLAHAPVLSDRRTASLGPIVAPETLAARLAAELEHRLGRGWADTHARWAERTGRVAV